MNRNTPSTNDPIEHTSQHQRSENTRRPTTEQHPSSETRTNDQSNSDKPTEGAHRGITIPGGGPASGRPLNHAHGVDLRATGVDLCAARFMIVAGWSGWSGWSGC